jgi:endonuclease-3
LSPGNAEQLRRLVYRLVPEAYWLKSASEPPLGNKTDPYDELIYITMTVMTRSQPRIDRAYDGLVDLVGERGWSALADIDDAALDDVLRPLGFVNRRREQLREIARRIEADHGGSLDPLRELSDDEAVAYLLSLPGVGVKTAKGDLMYSLGRVVLPIDIHVLRVAKRLGLVPLAASWNETDRLLEAEVPDELKYDLHVGFVIHGREVCRSRDPDCGACVLSDLCPSAFDAPRLRSDYVS